MDLLPKLRVGVDLMRGCRGTETFMHLSRDFVPVAISLSTLPSETNEFHKSLSLSGLLDPDPRGPRNHLDEVLPTPQL